MEIRHNSKALMWTILIMALIQMPQFAVLPATNLIATIVFPELSLQAIQTAMSLPGFVAVVAGVAAAMLVRYGLASKKAMTVFGLSLIALTGVIAFLLNTRFWQLCLMNILIGAGMGIFVPSAQSIMFDNFDEKTRQFISGISFSFINIGGVVMSLLCGILITIVWYGGHLQMLIAAPVAVLAWLVIPKDRAPGQAGDDDVSAGGAQGAGGTLGSGGAGGDLSAAGNGLSIPAAARARSKLPLTAYYYTAMIVIFMILYNVATVNISTYLEQYSIGESSTAGVATAILMAGGVACGFVFPKISQSIRDYVISLSFLLLAIGFTVMNIFPPSLFGTLVAMFVCGTTMSLLVPRCIFCVSNLSDPTNSATATMLVCCVAPGGGHFLSPVIMTNLTLAIGGESTRFRFQFTAYVCLAFAAILFLYNLYAEKRGSRQRCE